MLRSSDRLVLVPGAPPLNADGSLHESPPAAFGPFRVLHQVGAGSLGPVFRAHDAAEGRLVAIKAFRLDITPEQAAELAAALEALVADQPRHAAMAAAVAAGVEGTTAYLAQEYVVGEALDAVLRQFGPPPAAETLMTLSRVAEALDRAAGDGIHHGTLHPRDILLGDGGEARVVDLGVAQALERCGLRVPVRRPYSAPERVDGHAWGGPADIFSLGAIAFELLTGRRLAGPGRPAVSAPALSHVAADEIGAALERALSVDPAERYPSAADLVDALAPPLKTVRRTPPPARRRGAKDATPAVLLPLEEPAALVTPETVASPVEPVAQTPSPPAPMAPAPLEDLPIVTGAISSPPRFTQVDEPEMPAPSAPQPRRMPEAEPAATIADMRFGATAGDLKLGTARTEHAHADLDGSGTWPSILSTTTPAPLERRPFFPILVALLVGLAAGFGWGYWTAWRSPTRQAVVEVPDTAADSPAAANSTPAASSGTAVNIDEPEVIGERNLPPPRPTSPGESRPPTTPERRATPPSAAAPPPRAAPPERTPASPPGRLTVRSSPPGARVLVDGRLRGRTPLVLRDMPLRVLRVTIEQPGFEPDERRVALTARQPDLTVNARLAREAPTAPAATTGVLVVDSRPTGARVFVNDREVGLTPLSVPEIAPGTHRVRLEIAGFNSWMTTAQVTAGTRTRVAASLEQRGTPE